MQNVSVLNAGKALTDPLFVLLTISIVALVIAIRRERRERGRASRPLWVALVALLVMAAFSTIVVAVMLERSLLIKRDATNLAPDVIVIASGGSVLGVTSELDVLSPSSESRVIAAHRWWREHPGARVVISGSDQRTVGPSIRTIELMRAKAIALGIPASAITLETRSLNTREHALRVSELAGIQPAMRIGVVTSAWHMRRAMHVFRRRFKTVIPYPSDQPPLPRFGPEDLVPSSGALRYSTLMLHEWIGLAWYALRR
jgi:uncharacterized SAM-binding protein YcdF (DUF218 family)